MKKSLLGLIVVLGLIFLVACREDAGVYTQEDIGYGLDEATGEDRYVTVTHRSGVTEVPVNPGRVAVFDMAMLDTIDALGLSDRVVGLPQNAVPYLVLHFGEGHFADFGTLHEPNIEYMAGYELDLIIISGRARPYFEELSQLAPTIDLGLDITDMKGTFIANNAYLGQIFGVEDELGDQLRDVLVLFDEVNELASQLDNQEALIILYNEGHFQGFGPGGRFGIIHDVFGVPAVDPEVGINEEGESINHGMTIDNEYVYSVNPSMIFVIDRNYVLLGENPELHVTDIMNDIIYLTDAGQNDHIFYLNPEVWYIAPGGLQSMRAQVSNIIAALQAVLD